jgi:putative transposase
VAAVHHEAASGRADPGPVNPDFAAEVPGQKMIDDITYVETGEGWAVLATVIDCATQGNRLGSWFML